MPVNGRMKLGDAPGFGMVIRDRSALTPVT